MDRLRAEIATVEREETAELARETARTAADDRLITRVTLALAALAVLAGSGAALVFMRGVVRRLRGVERNAHLLAAGLPLEPLPASGDELGRLEAAIEDAARLLAEQRARLDLAMELGGIQVWEVRGDALTAARHPEAGEIALGEALAPVNEEDRAAAAAALAAVAEDGVTREFEVRYDLGGERWLANRVARVEHQLGDALLGVSMDVTDVKRAEEALRESERRRAADALEQSERRGRDNALLLASAGEGIYAVGPDHCCTSVNPAAARMLGYEVAELVGERLHELVHDRHPDGTPYDAADCPIVRSVRDGEPARVEGEVFWRRDGSRLPVEYTSFPILDEGVVRGAVVTFTDATARTGVREETERAAADLRRGIAAGELVLHYQPKVRLSDGACTGVEALVRWQRGDELVYPDAFVPLAERTGVVDDLTRWVVREALTTALAWRASGLDVKIAVNLAPPSLRDDAMVTYLAVEAGRLGSAPSVLEAEITESALAEDPESLLRNLAQLSAMGVRAAIDDFGTGFSSLSYLKLLPVSYMKIDKSFVMSMRDDARDRAIVESTIGLAHSLGLGVVAEGVEDEEVLALLRERGCDFGQGYHFSRPVHRDRAEEWLRARRR